MMLTGRNTWEHVARKSSGVRLGQVSLLSSWDMKHGLLMLVRMADTSASLNG
jgi:hypothetical protein